ncbi:MAG: tRNA (N(6)-L-threonylcarbamoyladenosine(37)-C(2))-methylthiotransferase MtaB [Candidatus Omnitrophota bacterium]|jgi:threonylcarbamoyladenosine tRNA methylthiotransferase MtaB|nr:MAG: tRNA (N(6)-L-threonylcarbamoyladenosine(37)-C(2))-methylthiotransferase MtaB [Candidatus Omnitrophota bacterium]
MSETNQTKPRVLIHTLGCKVNQYDSERLRTLLTQRGYCSVSDSDAEKADLIIVNTCSVTSESDRKGRQLIRKLIRQNPNARVAVTGCYSERKPHEILQIHGVDEIIPIENQEQWVDGLVETLGWGCEDQDAFWNNDGIDAFHEHTRAFVKIQDGCDLKCTFCSIPQSRGQGRSRPIPEVVAECRTLLQRGYPEIVLCGICIGHYGHEQDYDLPDLVEEIIQLAGIKRLRISSMEPQDVTDKLYETMTRRRDVVCPHLHLPLQSGSNRVLRRMKRPYTFDFFLERLRQARRTLPDYEISTDIMVGFPGETDDDFQQTLEAVRICHFSKVHSFRFSARENTPAMRMKDHVPATIVEERRRLLDKTALKVANLVKRNYIGREMAILSEQFEHDHGDGFTANYLRVDYVSPRPIARGEIVSVHLQSLQKGRLKGSIV